MFSDGFRNVGNTCYLNSALQALESSFDCNLSNNEGTTLMLIKTYQNHCNIGKFVQYLENKLQKDLRKQTDSLDFIGMLFNLINQENDHFLDTFYFRDFKRTEICKKCDTKDYKEESGRYTHYLTIRGNESFAQNFKNIFKFSTECDNCKSEDLELELSMKFPKTMIILFECENSDFDETIETSQGKYELDSMIIRHGGLSFGHYVAYKKGKKTWMQCNDLYCYDSWKFPSYEKPYLLVYKKSTFLKLDPSYSEFNKFQYSRQIHSIGGPEAQKKLQNGSSILMIGMSPLTIEIAKNLALSGISQITFVKGDDFDDFDSFNLNSQGTTEKKIIEKISSLNSSCNVSFESTIDPSKYLITILCQKSIFSEKAIKFNQIYHGKIKMIFCETTGVLRSYFVDFGDNYEFCNLTGDSDIDSKVHKITNVESQKNMIYKCRIIDKNRNLSVGDEFGIHGIEKSSCTVLIISEDGEMTFRSTTLIQIQKFLFISKIVPVLEMNCNSLEQEIKSLRKKNKRDELKILAQHIGKIEPKKQKTSSTLIKEIVRHQKILHPEVDSVIGGIVSQEVIKGVTGKFELNNGLNAKFFDDLISPKMQRSEIKNLRILIVGMGATGSELLKNLVMMDVGTGTGFITVVDPDHISSSNLCRQLWFHEEDIDCSKAEVAVREVKKLNPDIKINSIVDKISLENESFVFPSKFDDPAFWKYFDIVACCVDSFSARKDISVYCAAYGVPMFECGTMGLSATTTTFLPDITNIPFQNEGKSVDDAHNCTIKAIPYHSTHCIQWAIDQIQEIIKTKPKSAIEVFDDLFKNSIVNLLENKKEWKNSDPPKPISFSKQVKFHQIAFKKIEAVKNYDELEMENLDHLELIEVLSKLRCENFEIPFNHTMHDIHRIVANFKPAIISTTAIVSGLLAIECLKFSNQKSNPQFKQNSFSLSSNYLSRTNIEKDTSIIERISITSSTTVSDFLSNLEDEIFDQNDIFLEIQNMKVTFDDIESEGYTQP
eukprot:gene11755-5093_t